MTEFIHYIEKTLHCTADESGSARTDTLPLYLKGGYVLHRVRLADIEFLLAKSKETMSLATLRKQREQISKHTGMECVLCMPTASAYARQKMIDEAIPFVILEREVYLPFLGVALAGRAARELPPVEKISYAAQKLLLTAIYGHWSKVTLTEAANALVTAKMTVTRCYDEIEALLPGLIAKTGRNRYFLWERDVRALWDTVLPLLRNPVAKLHSLDEHLMIDAPLGGMSAICHYSMLADNPYTTYAVTKQEAKGLALDKKPRVPKGEMPASRVQVMQYGIAFADNSAVDPLSAILSLTAEEKSDPRVEAAIDTILEEYLRA